MFRHGKVNVRPNFIDWRILVTSSFCTLELKKGFDLYLICLRCILFCCCYCGCGTVLCSLFSWLNLVCKVNEQFSSNKTDGQVCLKLKKKLTYSNKMIKHESYGRNQINYTMNILNNNIDWNTSTSNSNSGYSTCISPWTLIHIILCWIQENSN